MDTQTRDRNAARRILVVDDDRDLVRSISAYLAARGYVVDTAHSGAEARSALGRNRPDAVVLDIMMETDAEGFHLAYELADDEATRRVPVIVVSGFEAHLGEKYSSFEFIQGRPWTPAKLFAKPVKLPELAGSIAALIGEREALERVLAKEA